MNAYYLFVLRHKILFWITDFMGLLKIPNGNLFLIKPANYDLTAKCFASQIGPKIII